jgi:transposase InsO family protein
MKEQKAALIEFVQSQKANGSTIAETLNELGVKRSTYYAWIRPKRDTTTRNRLMELTPTEKKAIETAKEAYPAMRHRQIQGILQNQGLYLSFSSVYQHLASLDMVEPYERRPSPLKEPRYSVWQRNLMWGCDWTKLLINHVRWYLIILIDFFSRYLIGYDICPSVNASHVKHLYARGLTTQGMAKGHALPELRVDRGSPNTSVVTREFFAFLGADMSFARVRRPTDNALTERFFGTAKQEEIYIVGSYPDEYSAHHEIGTYITFYNTVRPHQALWNFTPAHVHEVNNNSRIVEELERLKQQTRIERKTYWKGRNV